MMPRDATPSCSCVSCCVLLRSCGSRRGSTSFTPRLHEAHGRERERGRERHSWRGAAQESKSSSRTSLPAWPCFHRVWMPCFDEPFNLGACKVTTVSKALEGRVRLVDCSGCGVVHIVFLHKVSQSRGDIREMPMTTSFIQGFVYNHKGSHVYCQAGIVNLCL